MRNSSAVAFGAFDGRWLIKEKRIYRCNDETPLPGDPGDVRWLKRLLLAEALFGFAYLRR